MEIGTEISKKIRAAIKGKLQELGAYIDEELPDYIMVMVANKKTSQQMADDLSLFLGNNTIKFTTWLQGVLEKLRTVAVEPASVRHQLQSDSGAVAGKRRSSLSEDIRAEELKVLTVSSSRSDRTEARVSSSAHENRRGTTERSSSRLTSTVKPLMELLPSEAVIDIKPEMDDDFIAEDPVEIGTSHGRTRGAAGRPTAEIYRPGQSKFTSATSADTCRATEGSSHSRQQDSRSSRTSRMGSSKQEELSRKRKAPVASSVVRVNRAADEDSDDVEEEETGYGGRGVSSRVSLPSKPERKPTLPPAKQANRNLILKAISEAQDSITKTTAYPTIPQRQTVPVAPRTRLASSEEMTAAIQLVQDHLHSLAPRVPSYNSTELPPSRAPAPARSLASRLQLDLAERNDGGEQSHYGVEVAAGSDSKTFDTRSFIMSRPQLQQPAAGSQQRLQAREEVHSAIPRTVQAGYTLKERGDTASPKFIVTLDGVPSPLGILADCEMELDDVRPPTKVTEATVQVNREPKVSILQRLQGVVTSSEDDVMDIDMSEEDAVPLKKQKVLERCKFWPVCKSGDECSYHHPTTQCKTFPNCKFGDKCLFVHPNCKYDARCSKPECPFTHVSRRSTVAPPPRPAMQPVQNTTVCRFFPDCKKMECPFYHPKPCRFAGQCKRAGCTFYHPTTSVPPRHALKWTKTQSS
ncbi:zinc finger CCCH domain-containing protein 14 isoform X1 [Acanthopagrus latus]|uniref:zinc finger CCCH domain-containing protein 14 isoform X1 n=2 Tax=Acanthopagrus latus TaxID=8177 RepID=UPI00187C9671|nr:zinc finger CCCH domain-containing protein 14 isoform X1 [Acanthopagrus latus]